MKEEELQFIIKGMRAESFRSLNFDWRRQRINVPELIELTKALARNNSVKRIDFRGNAIGEAGARAIAEALKVNTTLLSLNLSENWIGDAGGKALVQVLKINSSLTKISGKFSEDICDEIAKELEVNLSFHAWRAQLYDCRNTDLPYQTKCAVLKAICSQMIAVYPGLMSEPQSIPQKALDLFTEVEMEISTTAVLIDHAHIFLITDKNKEVLRSIISIENQELIESCTASHVQPLSLERCRQLLTTLQPRNQYLITLVSNLTKHIRIPKKRSEQLLICFNIN